MMVRERKISVITNRVDTQMDNKINCNRPFTDLQRFGMLQKCARWARYLGNFVDTTQRETLPKYGAHTNE